VPPSHTNTSPAHTAAAYAPASIGNFAAGFDSMGAALAPVDGSRLGDVVCVAVAASDEFTMDGPYAGALAHETRPNLVVRTRGLFREAIARKGRTCGPVAMTLEKNLPINSGLGSSGSSICAALVALQAIHGFPLDAAELLHVAGLAEGSYSGGLHLDNVAPTLLGGLQLVVDGQNAPDTLQALPWPDDLLIVVVHPHFELATARSRAVLPAHVTRADALLFARNLAAFVNALHTGDRHLLGHSLRDTLAEPYRAALVPGFAEAKAAALAAGALGCSLSGSGPSIFAVASSPDEATRVSRAAVMGFADAGLSADTWVCRLDHEGTRSVTDLRYPVCHAGSRHRASPA
jgi:homoserine kinase